MKSVVFLCMVRVLDVIKKEKVVADSDFAMNESVEDDALESNFLGNGDIWTALDGDDYKDFLLSVMDKCSRTSNIKAITKDYCLLEYQPKNSLIAFETLFKHEEEQALWQAIYPFLPGIENELTLCELTEDNNRGYVLLKFGEARAMWMFQPLFIEQFRVFEQYLDAKNKRHKFMIAGLGWDITKITDNLLEIDEGPLYEEALEEFLASNPKKTKKDFPSVFIDYSYESLLETRDMGIKDAYYFASRIQEVTEFKCFKKTFYCLKIEVLDFADRYIDQGMLVNLYVSQNQLNGYCPAVHDNICGYMQLNAYMSEEQLKNMGVNAYYDDGSDFRSAVYTNFNLGYFVLMAIIAWKAPILLLPYVLIYPIGLLFCWVIITIREYFSHQKQKD